MEEIHIENADGMRAFAASFALKLPAYANAATVVALSGELGAGKTTFAQALAKALGVEDTVNSPTFVIEKIYALQDQQWKRLIHIDAYRLLKADELRHLGWDELVQSGGTLILIEWPEHVEGAIPGGAYLISIATGEGEKRTIQYGQKID